jgi:hypothetical protein
MLVTNDQRAEIIVFGNQDQIVFIGAGENFLIGRAGSYELGDSCGSKVSFAQAINDLRRDIFVGEKIHRYAAMMASRCI